MLWQAAEAQCHWAMLLDVGRMGGPLLKAGAQLCGAAFWCIVSLLGERWPEAHPSSWWALFLCQASQSAALSLCFVCSFSAVADKASQCLEVLVLFSKETGLCRTVPNGCSAFNLLLILPDAEGGRALRNLNSYNFYESQYLGFLFYICIHSQAEA